MGISVISHSASKVFDIDDHQYSEARAAGVVPAGVTHPGEFPRLLFSGRLSGRTLAGPHHLILKSDIPAPTDAGTPAPMTRSKADPPTAGEFSLTRRQFLARLGMASGGGAVLGAMGAWALMEGPPARRPFLRGRPGDTRILIIGAGISGLTVGYELDKLGYDYQILEARDRVGGVVWTVRRGTELTEIGGERQICTFDEGQYFNAGPWRIPGTHTNILDYCRELRVPLEPFVNFNDETYLYFEGDHVGPLSGRRVRLREVKADMRGHTAELLAKAVDQRSLDLPLTEEDIEQLLSYLVQEGYLETPDLVYRGGTARGPGGEGPYDLSALLASGFGNRFRSVRDGSFGRAAFQPVGGMDQIAAGFERAIGHRITLGAEVQSIRQTEDEVRVTWLDRRSGRVRELTAEQCVVCIPISVLRGIEVNFSDEMAEAVSLVNYNQAGKIGLQMARRFWEEDDGIFGGIAATNLPLGQLSYPANDFLSEKGVLLGFYANGRTRGPNETPLVDLSVAERVEHVLRHATKLHPQIRQEYESAFCAFWERIPYSEGAYATGTGPLRERLTTPDGRIHIGCAATSSSPAWFQGAIAGAWRAAEAVHERAQREAV
jgi:monoamine oxidase